MCKKIIYIVFFLLCISSTGIAQKFELPEGEKYQKINFELVNNLIILPIEVNGSKLSFILDSGVSNPILFNISNQDSIQVNNASEVNIRGLGGGDPIKVISSTGNFFKIGSIQNQYQSFYVVLDRSLNLSPVLGMPIHGIIGYQLFRDFVVDINYASKVIKFYDPKSYKYKNKKKSKTLPLVFDNKKIYINSNVYIGDKANVPVKLLIDTGSSDAIWLFENQEQQIEIPDKNYHDFLGKGLGGDIFGKRTRINNLNIGGFSLDDPKAAFPDMETYSSVKGLGNRNGSIGGEILKRFNVVFNYSKNEIILKKNKNFNAPFHYNMSGIDLQHHGMRYIAESILNNKKVDNEEKRYGDVYIMFENKTRLSLVPEIIVSGIRAGSPAHEAGLQEGDIILAVNGKKIHSYKLQEVLKLLNEKEGKQIRVMIERYNRNLQFNFVLKDVLK